MTSNKLKMLLIFNFFINLLENDKCLEFCLEPEMNYTISFDLGPIMLKMININVFTDNLNIIYTLVYLR